MSVSAAVASLSDFIDEDISLGNTYQKFFSYLVPREWDGEPTFKTLTGLYTSPKRYGVHFITTTTATYPDWVATKNKIGGGAGVELPTSPGQPVFHGVPVPVLSGTTWCSNMAPPMAYRFGYGVTEYPVEGMDAA